ncbi:MAG: hypothetical protein ABTD50_07985 [Polyangiaceae bacterium]|jgi:hypothetical protein
MPKRAKTGFDKYFDEQMKSPTFAKDYAEARAEIDAVDQLVSALDAARVKSSLTRTELATAIDARPGVRNHPRRGSSGEGTSRVVNPSRTHRGARFRDCSPRRKGRRSRKAGTPWTTETASAS